MWAARLRAHPHLAALLLIVILVYASSLSGDFVVDDVPVIRDNPHIQQSAHYSDFFSRSLWANTALENQDVPMYRPLFHVFHAMSFKLWGIHPLGYHVVLLLLHLVNTCLVYLLARRICAVTAIAAAFGAGAFALNPARVESVAWLSGITDPLTTLFLLLAMFAHHALTASKCNWRLYAVALVSFQCALWSKEVALAFPLVAMAYDLVYARRIRWGITALYALLAVAYLITRSAVLGSTGDWGALALPQAARIAEFVQGYCELLTFPIYVPFLLTPPTSSVASAWGFIGVLAILSLSIVVWRFGGETGKRSTLFALAWGLAFSWQAMLMAFYREGYYSARFLYLPAVGMALLAALSYDLLAARWKQSVAVGGTLLILCYGGISWKASEAWHDDGSIYAKIIRDAPDVAVGYFGLGRYYYSVKDYVRAEQTFTAMLNKRSSLGNLAAAYASLGAIRGMAGDVTQSRRYLDEAVRLDPSNSEAWTGLGNLAWMEGRLQDAISAYEKALIFRPANYEAAMNLANAYEKTGQGWRAEPIRRRYATGLR